VLGDRADNMERAIACYRDALHVYTREAVPQDWARLQMNMGIAWWDRVRGDRADNMERAIACYRDALQVWTPVAMPSEAADVQHNLGLALEQRAIFQNVIVKRRSPCLYRVRHYRMRRATPSEVAQVLGCTRTEAPTYARGRAPCFESAFGGRGFNAAGLVGVLNPPTRRPLSRPIRGHCSVSWIPDCARAWS
jgi:hypothetical protein